MKLKKLLKKADPDAIITINTPEGEKDLRVDSLEMAEYGNYKVGSISVRLQDPDKKGKPKKTDTEGISSIDKSIKEMSEVLGVDLTSQQEKGGNPKRNRRNTENQQNKRRNNNDRRDDRSKDILSDFAESTLKKAVEKSNNTEKISEKLSNKIEKEDDKK